MITLNLEIIIRHARLAKMLSTFPRGIWYQERPGELLGVPMDDMAVRI